MMLVKTSITKPLKDEQVPLCFKYKPMRTQNARKLAKPKRMLKGYEIGCFEESLNATITLHIPTQKRPSAPIADKHIDIKDVLTVQFAFTVLEKARQKNAVIINGIPISFKQIRKLLNTIDEWIMSSTRCFKKRNIILIANDRTPIKRVSKEKCFNLITITTLRILYHSQS